MVRGEAPRDALVPDPQVNQYPLTVRRISHGPFESGADWYNHIGHPWCRRLIHVSDISWTANDPSLIAHL